jgi:hypothetical protein
MEKTVGQAIADAERALRQRHKRRVKTVRKWMGERVIALLGDARSTEAFLHVPMRPTTREQRALVVAVLRGYVGDVTWKAWSRTLEECGKSVEVEALKAWQRGLREEGA